MIDFQERYKRTILVLGPPNSGKSVFSYLLFKSLRETGNDAALFDCDVYAPTFRRTDLLSPLEMKHLYCPSNAEKLEVKVPLLTYQTLVDYNFMAVRETGVIVMDGMGMYDEKTQDLIRRARSICVVCRNILDNEKLMKCNYLKDGKPQHPFEFYKSKVEKLIKITTFEKAEEGESVFESANLSANLYALSRDGIVRGELRSIPRTTYERVSDLREFLLENWF